MEGLSKGDKVESEYPFFLLYLRSLTSGTITRLSMIKMASEKAVFSNMAPFLNKILVLSTVWRYPQAKAVEFMSQRVPTKDFSRFLYKFSQSISSGEPLPPFIEREWKSWFAEYDAHKNQSIDRLKSLSDAYLPLMSVTLFLCTTMLISSVFYNPESMVSLAIMAVVAISFMLYLISWMIFKAAQPDEILIDQGLKSTKRNLLEKVAFIGLGLAGLSLLVPMESNFHHLIVVGILTFIPGLLGKRYVNNIRKIEEEFPTFLRFLGSNLKVDIPLKGIMIEALEIDFGPLNTYIKDLTKRLEMRVEPKLTWLSFETDIDSRLIQRVNIIITDTLASGGSIDQSSRYLEEFYHVYSQIRRRRYSCVSYHVGIMIPLYVVMAGLFATLDGFFSSLASFIGKISTMVDFMATPPIDFMRFFFMFTLVLFALNNVFSIYNMEGDSRFTMMYYLGMQLTLGGIFYLAIFGAVSGYLGTFAMPL